MVEQLIEVEGVPLAGHCLEILRLAGVRLDLAAQAVNDILQERAVAVAAIPPYPTDDSIDG